MANGHGGARPNSGPKPKDPAAIARALELIGSGVCANAQEAAEHPEIHGRIGWRQIHEARKKAERAATPKPAPPVVVPEPAGVAPATEEHKPPADLGTRERRLWRVEQRIESLSRMLAKAEAESNMARIGPLSGELRKWLDEQAKLVPPEPPKKEDEEARWRAAAASAIAKIERGVREVEGSAVCRKCGAACAACAKA